MSVTDSATFYVNWKGPTLCSINGKMANIHELHILAHGTALVRRLATIKIGNMSGTFTYHCPTPHTFSLLEVAKIGFAIRAERNGMSINYPMNNLTIPAIKAHHTYLLSFILSGDKDAKIVVTLQDKTEEMQTVRIQEEQEVFYRYLAEKTRTFENSLRESLLLNRTAYQGHLDAALAAID